MCAGVTSYTMCKIPHAQYYLFLRMRICTWIAATIFGENTGLRHDLRWNHETFVVCWHSLFLVLLRLGWLEERGNDRNDCALYVSRLRVFVCVHTLVEFMCTIFWKKKWYGKQVTGVKQNNTQYTCQWRYERREKSQPLHVLCAFPAKMYMYSCARTTVCLCRSTDVGCYPLATQGFSYKFCFE